MRGVDARPPVVIGGSMALFENFRRLVGGGRSSASTSAPSSRQAAGGPVRLLITPILGDADGTLQHHLTQILAERSSLAVTPYPRPVATGSDTGHAHCDRYPERP